MKVNHLNDSACRYALLDLLDKLDGYIDTMEEQGTGSWDEFWEELGYESGEFPVW